jgi:dihydropyrimidinase
MCGIPGIIKAVSDEFLLDAFSRLSQKTDVVSLVHAENEAAVNMFTAKTLSDGLDDLSDWAKTHPTWGEAEAIERASRYSSLYNMPIYFVHVSSKEGLEAIKNVKRRYKSKIFAETTSPYLALHNKIRSINISGKMAPPIRSIEDSNELWAGCMEGAINSIGTDNTTLNKEEKNYYKGIKAAVPGYPTLETHLSSMINEGLNNRGLELVKIIELMTMNPAKIFGLYPQKGTLMPGSDADIVILDIERDKNVSADELHSRADFSLYDNMRLKGWPVMTIKSGKVVAEGGYYLGSETGGKVIKR